MWTGKSSRRERCSVFPLSSVVFHVVKFYDSNFNKQWSLLFPKMSSLIQMLFNLCVVGQRWLMCLYFLEPLPFDISIWGEFHFCHTIKFYAFETKHQRRIKEPEKRRKRRTLERFRWCESASCERNITWLCSLEGLILKPKLQYFGHLVGRADSLEKALMLGKTESKWRSRQQRVRWLVSITNSTDTDLSKLWEIREDRGALCAASTGLQRVRHNLVTEQQHL